MKPCEIETGRLRLRPVRRNDLENMHSIWVTPGVRKFLWDDEIIPLEQAASVIEESLTLFERSGCGLWAAMPGSGERLIGFCGYWLFHDPPEMELLYGIAPDQ